MLVDVRFNLSQIRQQGLTVDPLLAQALADPVLLARAIGLDPRGLDGETIEIRLIQRVPLAHLLAPVGDESPVERQCCQMAAAVTQAQGVTGLGIHPQRHLTAHRQRTVAGQRVHHHEVPPFCTPLDRDRLVDEQLPIRADGPHAAGADGRFATLPAHCAHVTRLIGPEVALGMKGGKVGDQQAGVAALAADDAGLLLVVAQHEAGSGM